MAKRHSLWGPQTKRQVTWMRKKLASLSPSALIGNPADALGDNPLVLVRQNLPDTLIDLDQRAVDGAKPKATEYSLYDSQLPGFGLRVRPSGHSTFTLVCRVEGSRRTRRVTIGNPKVLTLREARKIARARLAEAHSGIDPNERRRRNRRMTTKEAFRDYESLHLPRLSPEHARATQRIFERVILRAFGDKAISEVKRSDVRRVTDEFAEHAPAGAINIHRAASAFFAWCMDREYIGQNPLYRAKLPAERAVRDNVIRPVELVHIWRACELLPEHWSIAIRILILTGLRKSEVLKADWNEFDFEVGEWTIPSRRSKNRRPHLVAITPALSELLGQLKRGGGYLFESPLKRGAPVLGLAYPVRQLKAATSSRNWRIHDIRRSVATGMAELRIQPHVIEAVLNHRSGIISGVGAIYNRHGYEAEKREALLAWQSKFFEVLRTTPPSSKLTKPGTEVPDDEATL